MKLRLIISQKEYEKLMPKHIGMRLGDYGVDKEGFFVSFDSTDSSSVMASVKPEYERTRISEQNVLDFLYKKLEEMGSLGPFTSHRKLKPEMHIVNDLGLDSLDIVELTMAIEDEYNLDIPDEELIEAQYIQKIIDYIIHRVN